MPSPPDPLPPVEKSSHTPPAASPPWPRETPAKKPHSWHSRRNVLIFVGALLGSYLLLAYFLVPSLWKRHARHHPSLDNEPRITKTRSDIPGDPLNVSLIGTEREIKEIMLAAKWYPADPMTLRSCLGMASASVLKRNYDDAPVSNLYLFGRKQDLAFQQAIGHNPRQRHHVRFWKSEEVDPDGRPIWMGAGTYDEKVGLSHTTGQITHHVAADVDDERDKLFADLRQTGYLEEDYVIEGFHTVVTGRNGGGDQWHTDGDLRVGIIGDKGKLLAKEP